MTFDEFKDKGTELEMDLDIVSRKTKSLGSSIDEHFVNLLLFQSQLKIMHWGTESYAQHKAYMKAYDSIDEVILNCLFRKEKLVNAFKRWIDNYKNKNLKEKKI